MKTLLLAAAAGLILGPSALADTTVPATPNQPAGQSPPSPLKPGGVQAPGTIANPDRPTAQPTGKGTGPAGQASGSNGMAGPHNPAPPTAAPPDAP